MKFFNLGLPEIIFIFILALIIFGPTNMVKTAKEAGALIRKMVKSPYWKEVWATRREINEIPKMLAKEAQLDEAIHDLNMETKGISSSVASTVSEFIKEVEGPSQPTGNNLKTTVSSPSNSGKPVKSSRRPKQKPPS